VGRARHAGDSDSDALRVCLVGGGSGGHLYPCVAIAEAIARRCDDVELLLIGALRGPDGTRLEQEKWPHRLVSARPLPYRSPLRMLAGLLSLARSQFEALAILRRFRPHVLVATGGYVSAGVVPAARLLRIPVVLHESDAVGGRTTRSLARFAAAVTVGFERSLDAYPAGKTHFTGQPLRPDITAPDRAAGREAFGLLPDARTLLVTGGSHGARRLNEATVAALPELLANGSVQVLHVAGEVDHARTSESVAGLDVGRARYHLVPYLDNMGHALAAADLIVCRAGAGTIAEVAARQVPAIVVPYPHAAAHQEANVQPLLDAGAAIVVRDAELSGKRLSELVKGLLADESGRRRMAEAAAALARPDAADAIAEVVISVARKALART